MGGWLSAFLLRPPTSSLTPSPSSNLTLNINRHLNTTSSSWLDQLSTLFLQLTCITRTSLSKEAYFSYHPPPPPPIPHVCPFTYLCYILKVVVFFSVSHWFYVHQLATISKLPKRARTFLKMNQKGWHLFSGHISSWNFFFPLHF